MPFSSSAQLRKCFAQQGRDKAAGRKSSWNCEEWAHETPNTKNLPEYSNSRSQSRSGSRKKSNSKSRSGSRKKSNSKSRSGSRKNSRSKSRRNSRSGSRKNSRSNSRQR